jgi:hypothetical protein
MAESAEVKPVASAISGNTEDNSFFVADNIDNLNKAEKYLQEAADYKDSSTLLDKVQKSIDYKNAEELFKSGKLNEAKVIFEKLGPNFGDCNKYIFGIDALSKVVGEWAGSNSDDYNNMVDVTCSIGAPYSLGFSSYKDCDWAIKAHIYIGVNALREGNVVSFAIIGNEGYDFFTKEQTLNDSIFINNENTYDLIFNSESGVFSRVILEYDEESDTILLQEIPYNITWTTAYSQGVGRMTLNRKK